MIERRRYYYWLLICVCALALPALWVFSAQAAASTLFVAPAGFCGGPLPCYATLQAAVDAAQPGDEIRVAKGEYLLMGSSTQLARVTKDLTILGGYSTGNWVTPDPAANPTILNAVGQGRVMEVSGPVAVTIYGLRLQYGEANGLGGAELGEDAGGGLLVVGADVVLSHSWVLTNTVTDGMGGGIYVTDSPHSFIMEHCVVQANYAESGGGAYLEEITSTLTSNVFQGNTSASQYAGGGLRVEAGNLTMKDNIFNGNQGGQGGGIALTYTEALLDRNTVTNNISVRGGGLHINESIVGLTGNLIQGNSSGDGGGLYVKWSNMVMVFNSVLDNEAKLAGGSMYGGGLWLDTSRTTEVILRGNLFEGNTASDGGGINMFGTNPAVVEGNSILDNTATDPTYNGHGGGVYCDAYGASFERNIIQRNTAIQGSSGASATNGGGITITKFATLTNNIITNNIVTGNNAIAPGIYVRGASPKFYHNTISGNIGGGGSGIYATQQTIDNTPAQPLLYNNIIANQDVGVYVSDGSPQNMASLFGVLWWNNDLNWEGQVSAYYAITGNPLFVNAPLYDYHIGAGSAAIDQSPSSYLTVDVDNEPRLGLHDLGADEYWASGALQRLFLPLTLKD